VAAEEREGEGLERSPEEHGGRRLVVEGCRVFGG
jgi:hypothetical protein